jgi:hypothetical protein
LKVVAAAAARRAMGSVDLEKTGMVNYCVTERELRVIEGSVKVWTGWRVAIR